MAQALPIVFTELLNLTAAPLGISGDAVKFGSCTLESDKYITCCEQGQVAIVDLSAGNALTRQTMSAEAAIMNPVSKILALKCASAFACLLVSRCLSSFSPALLLTPIFLPAL